MTCYVFEKLCYQTYCHQFNLMWPRYNVAPAAVEIGKNCGAKQCNLSECRIEKIDQKCIRHQENANELEYILITL